ncbi:MAG TPA: hypothetical protein VKX28_20120 [Xanthobacteraceae bacterium]|nr:hypothetical protein [Xanthobacteraceae bacterium]
MDSHPAGEVHRETPNERHNAVALTVFAVIILVLAALGGNNNVAGGVWLAFSAGILGMTATFQGMSYEHWRRSAAIFAGGVALVMMSAKVFSFEPSFIVYKVVTYLLLLVGFATMAIGLRGYARDFSSFFTVTVAIALTALITVLAIVLSLAMRTISFDFATAVLAVCNVAFAGAVTTKALSFDRGARTIVGPPGGGWQPNRS